VRGIKEKREKGYTDRPLYFPRSPSERGKKKKGGKSLLSNAFAVQLHREKGKKGREGKVGWCPSWEVLHSIRGGGGGKKKRPRN